MVNLFPRSLAVAALLSAVPLTAQAGDGHDHDGLFAKAALDRLEWTSSKGVAALHWEGEASLGGDEDKAVLLSRGTMAEDGDFDSAEVQVLWSHAISDFFDVRTGVRGDLAPDPERTSWVFGISGLAPYWIETSASLFVGTRGDVGVRLEADTDLALTTRLILQPSLELNATSKDDRQRESYGGLTSLEGGLRLRYEVTPTVAPYVGVSWERALGETNGRGDSHRHDDETTSLLAGLKLMF